ncbi:MAG: hypothetical protein FJY16_03050 [Bacteroidetes bacterium]|nr:hypothetical protein [Bacteroidota bacterium]
MPENKKPNRSDFMKTSVQGAIGVGRISREHDMFETLTYHHANIMAVGDVDSKRLQEGKQYVNDYYTKKWKTYSCNSQNKATRS